MIEMWNKGIKKCIVEGLLGLQCDLDPILILLNVKMSIFFFCGILIVLKSLWLNKMIDSITT